MKIYHGSPAVVKQPEISMEKFNRGFYCTIGEKLAVRWATRFGEDVVNVYEYGPDDSLKILKFEKMTEEWRDFIIACRSGTFHNWDIVEGPMADDTIYNYIQEFQDGKISREAFWALAKFRYPTNQICFNTQKALNLLKRGKFMDKNNISLFYTCSLVEFIFRQTNNNRKDVIEYLGDDLDRIYNYEDVFHCEPIEKVADDFINRNNIPDSEFDNISTCKYDVPDYWKLGKYLKG